MLRHLIFVLILTLFLFFELLFLIRFINVRKYVELKLTRYYPPYEKFPGWAKWIILLITYILIFMVFKWVLINIILEGIFGIPINDELQEWMLQAYGVK